MVRTIAKDHDSKRQHILKKAAEVFATEGYARASVSQVAQACGMSKANIYHYYGSKDDILFDVLDSYLSALQARLAALPLDAEKPKENLRALVLEILLAYQWMDHEHKIQAEGLPLLPEAQQEILKGYQRDMVRQMSTVLKEIAPEPFQDDAVRLRATTMSVFGMLNWFYMWNPAADTAARESYAELVADLTFAGVRGLAG